MEVHEREFDEEPAAFTRVKDQTHWCFAAFTYQGDFDEVAYCVTFALKCL